jgi:hypothetical protein
VYAEDATMILSDGPLSGRAAIEEAYRQTYEQCTQHPSKLEHVVAIRSDMMLRAGSWSCTLQGPARLVHQWDSWTTTDVLRGTTWQSAPRRFLLTPGHRLWRPSRDRCNRRARRMRPGAASSRSDRPGLAAFQARVASRPRPPYRSSTRCSHWMTVSLSSSKANRLAQRGHISVPATI